MSTDKHSRALAALDDSSWDTRLKEGLSYEEQLINALRVEAANYPGAVSIIPIGKTRRGKDECYYLGRENDDLWNNPIPDLMVCAPPKQPLWIEVTSCYNFFELENSPDSRVVGLPHEKYCKVIQAGHDLSGNPGTGVMVVLVSRSELDQWTWFWPGDLNREKNSRDYHNIVVAAPGGIEDLAREILMTLEHN